MADHGAGPEPGDQIEDLAKTVNGYLTDQGIERPRSQVHKRGVKGDRKSRVHQTVSDLPKIRRLITLEVDVVEADLRIHSIPDHALQQLFPKEIERHMNLYFLKNLPHGDCTSIRMCVPFITSGSFSQ